eukprot:579203-Prorocentrum_minimum.AAC.2
MLWTEITQDWAVHTPVVAMVATRGALVARVGFLGHLGHFVALGATQPFYCQDEYLSIKFQQFIYFTTANSDPQILKDQSVTIAGDDVSKSTVVVVVKWLAWTRKFLFKILLVEL